MIFSLSYVSLFIAINQTLRSQGTEPIRDQIIEIDQHTQTDLNETIVKSELNRQQII